MNRHLEEFILRHHIFATGLRKEYVFGDPFEIDGQIGTFVKDKKTGKEVLCFTCLDYLGLGKHELFKQKTIEYIKLYGTATIGSRVIMDSSVMRDLEKDISEYKGSEDCMLLSSGYSASSCLVSMIADRVIVAGHRMKKKDTFIFIDKLAHASIQEGLIKYRKKQSGCVNASVYPHLDYGVLENKLKATANIDCDRFIVADSLFSMTGSRPDCKILAELAKKYRAMIILDGAHCDGIFGYQGKGILFDGNISDNERRLFFESGTISKSMASIGGYICVPHAIADLGRVSQWRNIFSTALPTASVAASRFILSLIRSEEGEKRRKKLISLGETLLKNLGNEGFDTMNSSSYIIPIVIGDEKKCLAVQGDLFQNDAILVGPIRYPAVERGRAIIRIALTADHDEAHCDTLINALKRVRDKYVF